MSQSSDDRKRAAEELAERLGRVVLADETTGLAVVIGIFDLTETYGITMAATVEQHEVLPLLDRLRAQVQRDQQQLRKDLS